MFPRLFTFLLVLTFAFPFFSQNLDGKWNLNKTKGDFIELSEGNYSIQISDLQMKRKGDYLVKDSNLFLFGKSGDLSTHRFRIQTAKDSTLSLVKKWNRIRFQKRLRKKIHCKKETSSK